MSRHNDRHFTEQKCKFQLNIDFTSTNKKRKVYVGLNSIEQNLIGKEQQHEIHSSPTDKILLLHC